MGAPPIYFYLLVITFVLPNSGICANAAGEIPWRIRDTLSWSFRHGGVAAAKASIVEYLDDWSKEGDINIAVTGNSGVGKSSFINAFRGLSAEDQDAAEVGVIETTLTMKAYRHPHHDRIVLWDLPGIGTPSFRQYEYLDIIHASRFDAFVIMSSLRFTDNDMWLANRVRDLGKGFYFVRSKIRQDIENDKKTHPKTHRTDVMLDNIRNDCEQNLRYSGHYSDVYLIDNYEIEHYDFKQLTVTLEKEALYQKKKSLKHALFLLIEEFISAKKRELHDRIHGFAVVSAVAGAIPIPGLDIAVDLAALLEEIVHYRSSFGLNDVSLQLYARSLEIPLQRLKNTIYLKSSEIEYTTTGIMTYLTKSGLVYGTSYFISNIMRFTLPVIGSLVSAATSLTTTETCLNKLLDLMTEDARHLNRFD